MEIVLSNGTHVPSEEVTLSDGSAGREFALPSGMAVVRVRPIPPMMISDVMADNPDLIEPEIPLVKIGGIGEKWVPARTGQPEYEEWVRARKAVEKLRDQVHADHTWDYGVAEWKYPVGEEFSSVPPKTWKFPEWLKNHGKKPRHGVKGKRIDFIRYTLIRTNADMEACQVVMYALTNPLREEETDAIAALFQGDES